MFLLADPGEDPAIKQVHFAAIEKRRAERLDCLRKERENVTADAKIMFSQRVKVCRKCPRNDSSGCACRKKGCPARWEAAKKDTVCPLGKWPGGPLVSAPEPLVSAPEPRQIAAVIIARDEGEEVRLTCESLRAAGADRVIVVDDGSRDKSCEALPDYVELIRHSEPRGPAEARNAGARAALDCKTLVFSDAHCRVVEGNLTLLAETAKARQAIVMPRVAPLYVDAPWQATGGVLTWQKGTLYCKYTYDQSAKIHEINGLIGALYAMPSEIYRRLLGWPPTTSWGYNEQALSLAALYMAVPMYADPRVLQRHKFKKVFNYEFDRTSGWRNRYIVHWLLADSVAWADFWLPKLRAKIPKAEAAAMEVINTPVYKAYRDAYQARRIRTDKEVQAMLPENQGFDAHREVDGC